jgi:hypothetical protein
MKNKTLKKKKGRFAPVDEMQAAANYGIDIMMLVNNVKRSPAERIRRHTIAFEAVRKLQKAKFI